MVADRDKPPVEEPPNDQTDGRVIHTAESAQDSGARRGDKPAEEKPATRVSSAAPLEDLKEASLDLKRRIEEKRPPHHNAEISPDSSRDQLRGADTFDDPENSNR